jgi:protein-S-isoprenylcysteine O-methyltransferase Ste14
MESDREKINKAYGLHHKHAIHRSLAHSYTFYFIFFMVGMMLDAIFKISLFKTSIMFPVGLILFLLSTAIIAWAQLSYVNPEGKEIAKEHFSKGPYAYTRNPTHWGLFILILGFGFMVNGFFVILMTIVWHLLTKVTFIKKHEAAMLHYFGAPYEEYKKSVKI